MINKQELKEKILNNWVHYVIAIVILVAILLVRNNAKKSANVEEVILDQAPVEQPVETAPKPVVKPAPKPAVKPTPKMSYTDAVNKYGANRIQFGTNCQTTPNSSVYKNGAVVMLDNRSNVERSINIDGAVYKIPAYDYTVATLKTDTLPKTILVDCGNQQNVATILIQK